MANKKMSVVIFYQNGNAIPVSVFDFEDEAIFAINELGYIWNDDDLFYNKESDTCMWVELLPCNFIPNESIGNG